VLGWDGHQGKDRGGTCFDWRRRNGKMMMVTNLARSFDEHANTFKYAQIIPGNRSLAN
jgi:hypothetical protein